MAQGNPMPDSAATSHSDLAHDEWFRAEVNQAVSEADRPDSEWLPQEEARALGQKKRAEWLRNARTREKASA